MRSALASVPGASESDVTVDCAAKTATIALDGKDDPTPDALLAALSKTKFPARLAE